MRRSPQRAGGCRVGPRRGPMGARGAGGRANQLPPRPPGAGRARAPPRKRRGRAREAAAAAAAVGAGGPAPPDGAGPASRPGAGPGASSGPPTLGPPRSAPYAPPPAAREVRKEGSAGASAPPEPSMARAPRGSPPPLLLLLLLAALPPCPGRRRGSCLPGGGGVWLEVAADLKAALKGVAQAHGAGGAGRGLCCSSRASAPCGRRGCRWPPQKQQIGCCGVPRAQGGLPVRDLQVCCGPPVPRLAFDAWS